MKVVQLMKVGSKNLNQLAKVILERDFLVKDKKEI